MNPDCGKKFPPGHYGKKQKVCSRSDCQKWYKSHWKQTRQPPRGIPAQDFDRVLLATVRDKARHTLLITARETGLRKGEILGLTWNDLLDGSKKIRSLVEVRGQWDDVEGFKATKTKGSRLGMFSAKARKALEQLYKTTKPKLDSRIFPFSESHVWDYFQAVQKSLKIKNAKTGRPYRFHDIRHSVGVELVRAGRIDLAQKMLGHKSIESTMIYAERSGEEILDEVEKIRKKR